MCGVVVPKVEGVVEPVADTGLGDVGLFGEVEEKADVVLHIQPRSLMHCVKTHGKSSRQTDRQACPCHVT